MKVLLCSIYDKVSCVFNKPFTAVNEGDAIRAFTQSLDKQPAPHDYELYNLGVMDDNSGEVMSKGPVKLTSGLSVIAAETNDIPASLKEQAS